MECQQIHFHMQVIKRSEGRNAVAASSYRAAVAMFDTRTGVQFDFSKSNKEVVGFSEVMAPEGTTPLALLYRETLRQNVELAEKRADAQLCREFYAALPIELTKSQQIALMQDFCQSSFVDSGMICDTNMHDKKDNPHFHTMITMRDIDPEAELGFGKKNRTWNRKNLVDVWRHEFTDCMNKHLKQAGSPVRYSCETLEAQGIDRVAQIHEGPAALGMDERGEQSWRVEQNNKIINFNEASTKLKAIKAEVTKANAGKEEKVSIKATHAEAIEMERGRIRSMNRYFELIDQLQEEWSEYRQWTENKPVGVFYVESIWKQTASTFRKSILGIINSIKELAADYLDIYGRDVKDDVADISGNPDAISASLHPEPDDDVEINGP